MKRKLQYGIIHLRGCIGGARCSTLYCIVAAVSSLWVSLSNNKISTPTTSPHLVQEIRKSQENNRKKEGRGYRMQ